MAKPISIIDANNEVVCLRNRRHHHPIASMRVFDALPIGVREAVRTSDYKLCVFCIREFGQDTRFVRRLEGFSAKILSWNQK